MVRNIIATLGALAALSLAGCGGLGDDTTSVTTEDMAMQVFKVVSGPYTVSNVVKVSDACMLGLENPTTGFTSIQVTNDGHGNLSLGTMCMTSGNPPTCNPAVYTNGTGMFTDSYHVTTTATTTVTADSTATCTFSRTRTNMVTVTADNKLHIEFKEDESTVAAGCGFSYTTCTSQYTFDAGM